MVLPLLTLTLAGLAWAFHLVVLAISSVGVLFAFLVNRRNGSTTGFIVTDSEVESHGNLGYISQRDVIMQASEVEFLGYSIGARGRPWGLYAGGFGLFEKTCVMPSITQDEAGKMLDEIRHKFPGFDPAIAAARPDRVAPQITP